MLKYRQYFSLLGAPGTAMNWSISNWGVGGPIPLVSACFLVRRYILLIFSLHNPTPSHTPEKYYSIIKLTVYVYRLFKFSKYCARVKYCARCRSGLRWNSVFVFSCFCSLAISNFVFPLKKVKQIEWSLTQPPVNWQTSTMSCFVGMTQREDRKVCESRDRSQSVDKNHSSAAKPTWLQGGVGSMSSKKEK